MKSIKAFSSGALIALSTVLTISFTTALVFQNCARIDFKSSNDVLRSSNNNGLGNPDTEEIKCRTAGGIESVVSSISGPSELEQAEIGTFNLSALKDCDNRFSITWYTTDLNGAVVNADQVAAGPQFQAGFAFPGVYLVVARILDSNLQAKEVTHQVLVREKCRSGSACNDELGRSAIRGPTVGYVGDLYRFEVSSKIPISRLVWYFGSSSSFAADKRSDIDLSFRVPGIHEIRAEFEDFSGKKQVLKHYIHILERPKAPSSCPGGGCPGDSGNQGSCPGGGCPGDSGNQGSCPGGNCPGDNGNEGSCPGAGCPDDDYPSVGQTCDLSRLDLSGPSTLGIREVGVYAVYLPDCTKSKVEQIEWSVDNSLPELGNSSREFSFGTIGWRVVKVHLRLRIPSKESEYTDVTLSRPVWVIDDDCRISVPPVKPPTVPPNSCFPLKEGDSLEEVVGITFRDVACGYEGKKRVRYDYIRSRMCVNGRIALSPITERKAYEGPCTGQSCYLSNGGKLGHGQSVIRYTSNSPVDSCKKHEVSLTCQNGKLSRNDKELFEKCLSGCPGVGKHGTEAYSSDGREAVEKMCPFGERGFFDHYKKEKQIRCNDGAVVDTGKTRRGDLLEAGICPTYGWKQTDWTICSADCGGEQNAVYTCFDNKGAAVGEGESVRRCGVKPSQKRICSLKPDSKYEKIETKFLPSQQVCPANQVGSIAKRIETTSVYVCKDHKYQKASESSKEYTESYCKPYASARCSHDSLSPSQALGRYAWMKKCEPQVPMIADFFERMKGLKENPEEIFKQTYKVDAKGRATYGQMTYVTFMKADGTPWIAPAPGTSDWDVRQPLPDVAQLSCQIPAGAKIASVCLSSCLVPNQKIAVDLNGNTMSILDAMNATVSTLPVLTVDSTIGAVEYRNMRVDRFVTELVDTQHFILSIKTAKGRSIEVTQNHPMLIATGVLVEARELSRGSELVGRDGQPDPITQIELKTHFGKVYNVFMSSSAPEENLVLSQDLIVGSGHFQNEGSDNINRMILRQKLVEGAVK